MENNIDNEDISLNWQHDTKHFGAQRNQPVTENIDAWAMYTSGVLLKIKW